MTKIKCLIVDDEPLAAGLIKKHLEHFSQFELVATCWNPLEAFEYLEKEEVDLIFLDIQMPVMNGMEFLRSLKNPPDVILVTAYRDYAAESYELEVVDYLVKPITMNRFFKAINRYLAQQRPVEKALPVLPRSSEAGPTFIYVNANRRHVKISFQDILYIESLKDYIRIHMTTATTTTKEKISEFEQKLPAHFLRVHRSFIVNLDQVTAFTNHDIEIREKEIPIGVSYKQMVFEILKK